MQCLDTEEFQYLQHGWGERYANLTIDTSSIDFGNLDTKILKTHAM